MGGRGAEGAGGNAEVGWGAVWLAEKCPQPGARGEGEGQYSEGSKIVVADRSASVITQRRSPVEVL